MKQPGLDNEQRRTLDEQRVYGAVRTSLIGYGIAAYTYLHVRSGSGLASQAPDNWGSAPGFVLSGLALQFFLLVARALIKRYAPDRASANQSIVILEIIADGATVLLFAMATLGAVTQAASDL